MTANKHKKLAAWILSLKKIGLDDNEIFFICRVGKLIDTHRKSADEIRAEIARHKSLKNNKRFL